MKPVIRKLCMKALGQDSKALCALGIRLYYGRGCVRDRKLSKLCLKRAVELGSEEAYFFYHSRFSKGKKVIDDRSYNDMLQFLYQENRPVKKQRLRRYLSLGTTKQKQRLKLLQQSLHKGDC